MSGTAIELPAKVVKKDSDTMNEERDIAPDELARRRRNARRTALFLGAIVLAIFTAFLITGVTGRG